MTSMTDPERVKGMQTLAQIMLESGCSAVIGIIKGTDGLLAVADDMETGEVVDHLRAYADAIENMDRKRDLLGQVDVEVELP